MPPTSFLVHHVEHDLRFKHAHLQFLQHAFERPVFLNQPELVLDRIAKKASYASAGHRLSGLVYVVAGLLKGATASILAVKSHSLGYSRVPMFGFGLYDVFTGLMAYKYIRERNIVKHREWMIRNFAVGAGSIWVSFSLANATVMIRIA